MLDSSESLNLVLNKANLNEIPGNSKREKRKKRWRSVSLEFSLLSILGTYITSRKIQHSPQKGGAYKRTLLVFWVLLIPSSVKQRGRGKRDLSRGLNSLLFHLIRSASHQLNNFVSCKPQKLLEVLTKTYSCGDSRVEKTEVTDGHLQERAWSSQWLKPQCTVFHSAPGHYLLFPLMSLSPAFATKLPLCIVSCPPVPAINSHC